MKCDHCGADTGITYGTVNIPALIYTRRTVYLCHTGYPGRPDCFRRVTVYREPLGILKCVTPLPDGINDIKDEVMLYLMYAENNPQTCPPENPAQG